MTTRQAAGRLLSLLRGPGFSSRGRRIASRFVSAAILFAAAWLLLRAFRGISLGELVAAFRAQPAGALLLAGLLTAGSFAALASYDLFAARLVAPGRIGARRALLAGATANAFSNTLGLPAVTATAVRLRVYGAAGIGVGDVARITALSAGTLVLGFASMLGVMLVLEASDGAKTAPAAGAAIIACLGALAFWLSRRARRFSLGGWQIEMPPARLALLQMVVGGGEMAAAIGALAVLLPADVLPPFPVFAVAYIGAVTLGLGSQAPGGLGVFEAAMIAILGRVARGDVLAALLAYRLIYNIVPFMLAALALALTPRAQLSSTADKG